MGQKPHSRNPQGERGASLVATIMAMGASLAVSAGILQVIEHRQLYQRILRAKVRMEITEAKIINAAKSQSSMYLSAAKKEENPELYECLYKSNCTPNPGNPKPFTLYDSSDQIISGYRHSLGLPCDPKLDACALFIETKFEISCESSKALACDKPAEILTTYTLRQHATKWLSGRKIPSQTGYASLSLFSCPENQYVTGIDFSGKPICNVARRFALGTDCGDHKSYGITEDGLMLCQNPQNYCGKNLSLVLVIDKSGSMNGEKKMTGAKEAAVKIIQSLKQNQDGKGLVAFSSDAKSSFNQTFVTDSALVIKDIQALTASGSTNMAAAWNEVEGIFKKVTDQHNKVVIFLSDGMITAGGDPRPIAARVKALGAQVWTIGLGIKTDQNVLRDLATTPNDYVYAPTAEDLVPVFNKLAQYMCRQSQG